MRQLQRVTWGAAMSDDDFSELLAMRQRVIELREELARREAIVARLHSQLMECEAARQRRESRGIVSRLREAWRTCFGR